MGLLDGIEKLITEHGSAAILRERIALAEDKYSALERKVVELEAENKNLKLNNYELKDKVRDLEEQFSNIHGGKLDEIEGKILALLSTTTNRVVAPEIAQSLGIHIDKAKYYLTQLEENEFVLGIHYYTGKSTEYALAQGGREYLVKNKLV